MNKYYGSFFKYPDFDMPEQGIGTMVAILIEINQKTIIIEYGQLKLQLTDIANGNIYDIIMSILEVPKVGFNFLKKLGFKPINKDF